MSLNDRQEGNVDLTVAAVPVYFGTMAAERKWLERRAAGGGPSQSDYTKPDTLGSLAMGVGSLVIPLVTHRLARHLTPGKSKYGTALVGTAVAAVAVTTIADRVADALDRDRDDASGAATPDCRRQRRRRWRRIAGHVRRISGPAAMLSGGLAVTTTFHRLTDPQRQWELGGRDRDLGNGPLAWTVAIAGWDFIYYWNHRMMHETRFMWAHHVVHHSSERYNLSTALRQPIADVLGVWVPYGWLSRMGVRPTLVEQARAINLLYQYWIHTDAIRSLGRGEEVLNTPSHHRVHHGANPKYIDRNHGSILIIWDRLFGTFQREEEPVVYGLTKNIESYNPVVIGTHEWNDIGRDVARSTTWRDRLSFVFRGPGWAYQHHADHGTQARAEEAPHASVPA